MRVNLAVPYGEKDDAKRLGARWDHAAGAWYVEDAEDLTPFLRWMSPHLTKPHRRRRSKPKANLEIRLGGRVVGEHYRRLCDCTTPPWVECPHTEEPE